MGDRREPQHRASPRGVWVRNVTLTYIYLPASGRRNRLAGRSPSRADTRRVPRTGEISSAIRHPIDVAVSDTVDVEVVDMRTQGAGRERQMSADPSHLARPWSNDRPSGHSNASILYAAASSTVPPA